MDNLVHALTSLLGSIVGAASIPAITAGIAWKYRTQLLGLLEKHIAARFDAVAANTELGKRIKSIDDKLSTLMGEPQQTKPQ